MAENPPQNGQAPAPCEFPDMVTIDEANLLHTMHTQEEIDAFRIHETICNYCQHVRATIHSTSYEKL